MDAIKVAKVDRVLCSKSGSQSEGTLHLTAHHLIFKFNEPSSEEEMWVPYPLIGLVTRLPQTLQGNTPLAFRCRTFESFTFSFKRDADASDVFDSVRELTVAPSVEQLYAFFYQPSPSFDATDGWSFYSPREEFARMGVGSRTKAWRFTDLNKDYIFCSTYPARLVVPAKISDAVLTYAGKYRSKCRVPALTYLHWSNNASITRSSQPMVGVTNNRSAQDEKLVSSIFQSQYADTPYSIAAESRARASKADPPVYGSTSTNLIIDARPTVNAMVMTAKGAGTENMDHYKDARKAYLGVENIHVMRDSLAKVVEALREADAVLAMPGLEVSPDGRIGAGAGVLDRQALRRSGWLRHITCLLEGTVLIVRNIHINSSHVLIHCSDGWDRTSQLSALAQLCLDPFYRTYRGFQVLIEKDWLSFGYKFADRCGHLSSDKFFVSPPNTDGADAAQAFLASVQNKFASQSHLKETSPVFHQFLECVRQMQRQFPTRFEFNERFLERLHYHLYSCQFGTFLYNSERERRTSEQGTLPPYALTKSIWDYFNSTKERPKFLNPDYEPSLDDRNSRAPGADMGVLLPNPKDVRFWHELYGRSDEDMNGRIATSQLVGVEVVGPIEGAEDDPIIKALPISRSPSPAPSSSDTLSIPYKPRTLVRRNSAVSVPDSLLPPSSPSLPDLSNRPTTPQPQGLLRPSVSSSNVPNRSWTLGSPGTSTPPSASTQPPERRPGPSAAVNTAGGMKSVWGKLSQNASAAFSAVQGAYGEATKDFKGLSLMSGVDSDGRSDELKPWDNAGNREASEASNGWGQSDYQPVARLPSADLRNPWSDSNVIPGTAGLSNVPRPIPVPAFPRESITPPAALFHPPSRPRSQPEVLASVSPEANQGFPLSSSPRPDPLRTASSVLPSPPAQDADLPVNPRPTRSNPLPASPRPQSPIAQNPSANQDPLGVGFL